jgi:hypothetical protein
MAKASVLYLALTNHRSCLNISLPCLRLDLDRTYRSVNPFLIYIIGILKRHTRLKRTLVIRPANYIITTLNTNNIKGLYKRAKSS